MTSYQSVLYTLTHEPIGNSREKNGETEEEEEEEEEGWNEYLSPPEPQLEPKTQSFKEKLVNALDNKEDTELPEFFTEKKILTYLNGWLAFVSDGQGRDPIISAAQAEKLPQAIATTMKTILKLDKDKTPLFVKLMALGAIAKAELARAPWHRSLALKSLYERLVKFSTVRKEEDVLRAFEAFASPPISPMLDIDEITYTAQRKALHDSSNESDSFETSFQRWLTWAAKTKQVVTLEDLNNISAQLKEETSKTYLESIDASTLEPIQKHSLKKVLSDYCAQKKIKIERSFDIFDLSDALKKFSKFYVSPLSLFGKHHAPEGMQTIINMINGPSPQTNHILTELKKTAEAKVKDWKGYYLGTRSSDTQKAYEAISDALKDLKEDDQNTKIKDVIDALDRIKDPSEYLSRKISESPQKI